MSNLTFSEIKTIKNFCEDLFSEPDWREVVENLAKGVVDFEVNNVRFINTNDIDRIQGKELGSDLYYLGCFDADFIAEQTGWLSGLVKCAQEGKAFEKLGELIFNTVDMTEFAIDYSSVCGYGHYFNRYNFSEKELQTKSLPIYHVFDNH